MLDQQKTARKDFRIRLNNISIAQIKTTKFRARILLIWGSEIGKVENDVLYFIFQDWEVFENLFAKVAPFFIKDKIYLNIWVN